jgi:hypothetical protein
MKRFFLGFLFGVGTFSLGAGAGFLAWPAMPDRGSVEPPQAVRAGLCELVELPDRYDGKIVRVTARYGWVNPTVLGHLQTHECPKLLRAACPPQNSGCRKLLSLQSEDYYSSVGGIDVVGRFIADDRTPRGRDHVIEIWDVMSAAPAKDRSVGAGGSH